RKSPAGPPSLVERAEQLHAAVAGLIRAQRPHDNPYWRPLAAVLESLAGSPAAEPVLELLARHVERLQPNADARKAVARAGAAPDTLGRELIALELAASGLALHQAPGLEQALARPAEL